MMSFNGRTKKIFTGGGEGGAGLILFNNYCAEICRKHFLFYFPTTHSLFFSATAAFEIGLSHLYENTNLLYREIQVQLFVAMKLLQAPHRI